MFNLGVGTNLKKFIVKYSFVFVIPNNLVLETETEHLAVGVDDEDVVKVETEGRAGRGGEAGEVHRLPMGGGEVMGEAGGIRLRSPNPSPRRPHPPAPGGGTPATRKNPTTL